MEDGRNKLERHALLWYNTLSEVKGADAVAMACRSGKEIAAWQNGGLCLARKEHVTARQVAGD